MERPVVKETTALGAAYLAGLSAGVYQGLDEIQSLWRSEAAFEPSMDSSERSRRLDGWGRAIAACLAFKP